MEIIALVRDGALEVIDLGNAGARVHDLMKKYADRPMDLADASLVWTAEHTGIEQVMTIDSDFAVFRQRFDAGYDQDVRVIIDV